MKRQTGWRACVFLACSALLVGCVRAGSPALAPVAATKPKVFTQTLIYNSYPEMDPSVGITTEVYVFSNVYETLIRFNPPGSKEQLSPVLATKWESSNGGKTWTFHLRQGVKFHDGTHFNAQAVKFSIERTKAKLGPVAFIWDSVKEIKIVDDYTIIFELSTPAPLDLICTSGYYAWMMSPSIAGKDSAWFNAGHDAGTGPYTIQSYTRSGPIILSRYDNYWGGWKEGHAVVSGVQLPTPPTG